MNKIQQKLNNHPRLKKCLKLLAVVGMCLSVLFNALILGVVIADNVRNGAESKSVKNVATTPITKRSMDYNGYNLLYSLGEILNTYMLDNFIDEKPQFWAQMTLNSDVEYSYGEYPGCCYGTWGNVDYDTLVIRNAIHDFNGFKFHIRNDSNINEYRSIYNIDFYVINTQTHNEYQLASFSYIKAPGASGSVMNVWGTSNLDLAVSISNMENPKLASLLYDPDLKGYGEGYNDGYNSGKTYGYNQGYTTGYQDGLDNSPSNVFDILATAFNSVASILNIELLPNLPLGLLIFTPVVVAVIIVVVKMIKG